MMSGSSVWQQKEANYILEIESLNQRVQALVQRNGTLEIENRKVVKLQKRVQKQDDTINKLKRKLKESEAANSQLQSRFKAMNNNKHLSIPGNKSQAKKSKKSFEFPMIPGSRSLRAPQRQHAKSVDEYNFERNSKHRHRNNQSYNASYDISEEDVRAVSDRVKVLNRRKAAQNRFKSHSYNPMMDGSIDSVEGSSQQTQRSQKDRKRDSIHYPRLSKSRDYTPVSRSPSPQSPMLYDQSTKLKQQIATLTNSNEKLLSAQILYQNEVDTLNFQLSELEKQVEHLEDGKERLSAQKNPKFKDTVDNLLGITLLEGIFVRKYNRRGKHSFKRLMVHFQKGYIDYESGMLSLKNLVSVQRGVQSDVFRKSHHKGNLVDNVDTCLTLTFPRQTLDIQTAYKLQARCLHDAFQNYLKQMQKAAQMEREKVQSYGISDYVVSQLVKG